VKAFICPLCHEECCPADRADEEATDFDHESQAWYHRRCANNCLGLLWLKTFLRVLRQAKP